MARSDAVIHTLNRDAFFQMMPENSVAVIFAKKPMLRSGDTEYPYCQDKNFYYLTGYNHKGAILLLIRHSGKRTTHLFIPELTATQIHWFGNLPDKTEAKAITGIELCKSLTDFPGFVSRILKGAEFLLADYPLLGPNEFLSDTHQFIKETLNRHPHLQVRSITPVMTTLRLVKHAWEIDRIRQAIQITYKGLEAVLIHARSGIFEYELEAHYNFQLHVNRSCPAFTSIFASGKNATVLHYSDNNHPLKPGALMLLDFGAEYQHYSADISRTFPVDGKFTSEQAELYDLVLDANISTISKAAPGMTLNELNNHTKKVLSRGLLDLKLIRSESEISNYFTHGVSHMLGLDTHDLSGDPDLKLKPGMVITVEPGLYFPEKAVGIRIEDDILITENGSENLSDMIPKTRESIEQMMQG